MSHVVTYVPLGITYATWSGLGIAAICIFGIENEIVVNINSDNGDIGIFRKLLIVENPENSNIEITLNDAIKINETNKRDYRTLLSH